MTCTDPSGGACVELGMDDSVFIRDTQLSDSGTYTCLANNSAGVAVYEVHVLVEPSAGQWNLARGVPHDVVSVSKNRAPSV